MMNAETTRSVSGALRSCASWADVERCCRQLTEQQKGDLFEQLVKAYLLLEPEYASKLRHVWLQRDVPSAVREKLKLPATDQGIDLVAETRDGEFWAVQCKFRQPTDRSLAWREISTFTGLAFGVCRGFSFGIICSTTERITHVLKDQERIGFCALDVWQGLDAEFFARLRAHLAHQSESLAPLKPRPHQKGAVKDGYHHFVVKKAKRGKLIMPCGSGKSLTAYWIADQLQARRIVIAVPSLALIRQTLKVWLRETLANGRAVEWICVCSDESAGRIERDDVAVLRQDLGVPCLTAPEDIAAWLKRKHHGWTVVFTTYQSGEALARAARSAKFRFDLGIMDEAHKTVGAADKLFSHLLHDANLPIRRRLFMTATERRYVGQSDAVLSMDNPAIYGETFHLLSFKRALEYAPPILSDYKIISICVSRDEVAELIRKNVFVKPDQGRWSREIEADMLASLIALRKAMVRHPIRHAVSFHGSIQRAELFKAHNEAFTRAFPRYGGLETFHVSGRTPTGTRARIIGDFAQARRGLVTNARCLTEGVDVPGIDCVLFADPRRSAVDIVQAVGRALRPSPGKKLGYVIVPILHDADALPEDIFESDSFQEVLTTLRALAANDDRIIEYFRGVSQGRQRTSGGSVEFDVGERLAKRINLAQFVREIDLKCWNRLAKLSWRPFEEAREFARSLQLNNRIEWNTFCKGKMLRLGYLPVDIPQKPERIYADKGWKGVGDWLGTGRIANQLKTYRPFSAARAFVHTLKLRSRDEWIAYCGGRMCHLGRMPADIPLHPNLSYASVGWKGMGDWLGTGTVATRLREFRPFHMARAFARRLKLNNRDEWSNFCKGGMPKLGQLPKDIPASPERTYADKGWKGMGDWLGTSRLATNFRTYRPFYKAREFARKLKLKSGTEWFAFCKGELPKLGRLPADIPVSPKNTYIGKGWKGMGDWLGTGTVAPSLRQFRPFREARSFARKLGLKSSSEWRAFCKGEIPQLGRRPNDIPAKPYRTYSSKGWQGMGDWIGTKRVADQLKKYRVFREARIFVRKLKLKNRDEWSTFCKGHLPHLEKLPSDIPAGPARTYADKGWKGMGDWLGTGTVANQLKQFRPFPQARSFVRKLKLKSKTEWQDFCKGKMHHLGRLPKDIPANPSHTFAKKGWRGYGDWLGTGNVANFLKEYRSFHNARKFTRNLKLKNQLEWRAFCMGKMCHLGRLPKDIPANPSGTYAKKGWRGYGDWLGTGSICPRLKQYRPFVSARSFVRKLKLKNNTEWCAYCKGEVPHLGQFPKDIPATPQTVYLGKGWKGYGDWLGTGTVATFLRKYRSFHEARAFVRDLKLKSRTEWFAFIRGEITQLGRFPMDIPTNPNKTYSSKGWRGMGDWLGTGRTHRVKASKPK
ncbi:MAG: DEAD/DEAH box helicase family protein [Verrucomicrobiota bacterium]